MPAVHLFLTIALSLSATAYDASKLRRRDIVPVDNVGLSNRDLSLLLRANTSDANSLNMNSERALDDHRLARRRTIHDKGLQAKSGTVELTVDRGLFTGTAIFYSDEHVPHPFHSKPVSGVVFDTGSNTTWALSETDITRLATFDFKSMGTLELSGRLTQMGTVKLQHELLVNSDAHFASVGSHKNTDGYKGQVIPFLLYPRESDG
ncbi:hypothetical protein APHAL10511_008260 [Amanita phalloides]|nr:hypothetical protein APHAL10511_008260 [Amanita phalloides]